MAAFMPQRRASIVFAAISALPSFKGRLPRLSLWNNSLKRAEVGQDILASEGQPTVVELQTFLSQGGFQLINESLGNWTTDLLPRRSGVCRIIDRVPLVTSSFWRTVGRSFHCYWWTGMSAKARSFPKRT